MRNRSFLKNENIRFALVVFIIWAGLYGCGKTVEKVECEQKQELNYVTSFTYEYHFPSGCLMIPVDKER